MVYWWWQLTRCNPECGHNLVGSTSDVVFNSICQVTLPGIQHPKAMSKYSKEIVPCSFRQHCSYGITSTDQICSKSGQGDQSVTRICRLSNLQRMPWYYLYCMMTCLWNSWEPMRYHLPIKRKCFHGKGVDKILWWYHQASFDRSQQVQRLMPRVVFLTPDLWILVRVICFIMTQVVEGGQPVKHYVHLL